MCSQRLPRPGRLCRECELERNLSRSAKTPDSLVTRDPGVDESLPMPGIAGWAARLPRPMVILSAMAVGLTVATAVYVLNGWPGTGRSVMIDRDLSSLRQRPPHRSFGGASSDAAARSGDMTAHTPSRGPDAPVAMPIVATGSMPAVVAVQRSGLNERVGSAAPRAPVAYDRVLRLADALDRCALESPFARLACEQRARAHYCEGVNGRIPQCIDAPSLHQVQ